MGGKGGKLPGGFSLAIVYVKYQVGMPILGGISSNMR